MTGGAVEKVPKQVLGRGPEKNDFTECARTNDLIVKKDHMRPLKTTR
jgi:hypothetical protein